jgi:SAM-dependent methyltransferase
MKFWGPKDIKYHVNKFINNNAERFTNKTVIDVPAGTGISSETFHKAGANVEAYDLYPEFFKVEGVECKKANILKGIPVEDSHADFILCQEGIEHMSDQIKTFREFNRVLKTNGSLIITTPNYSSMRSRLGYYLGESENHHLMPPNELESIWMAEGDEDEIYYGHIFLIGIQKLRIMAHLSGFRIKQLIEVRGNVTSLVLTILAYPFIWINRQLALKRAKRKIKGFDNPFRDKVLSELHNYSLDFRVLCGSHLFIEFEKVASPAEVNRELRGKMTFDQIT